MGTWEGGSSQRARSTKERSFCSLVKVRPGRTSKNRRVLVLNGQLLFLKKNQISGQ